MHKCLSCGDDLLNYDSIKEPKIRKENEHGQKDKENV